MALSATDLYLKYAQDHDLEFTRIADNGKGDRSTSINFISLAPPTIQKSTTSRPRASSYPPVA